MRLLNASGCLDALTAPEVAADLDAFVTKTVTPLPRGGNEPVRIAETEVGMLNAIGLANPGIDGFLHHTLPRLSGLTVWVSVGGFSVRDYADICERLEGEEIAAIELNLSCPNVDEVPSGVGEVVAAARAVTSKPLYAKLAPAADVAESAKAATAAGADGLSLVNTVKGMALDERTGGLSGPALRPLALAAIFAAHQATRLPIVGMGGVASGRDAVELLAAGASDIALGTILFSDPAAPSRIVAELEAELAAHGFADPDNAVGAAHEPEASTLDPESRVGHKKGLHTRANVVG